MASRIRSGAVLAVARQSAALLRELVPNRRAVTDLVDEIWCPGCTRWVRPREFIPAADVCASCLIDRAGRERGWSR